MVKKFDQAHEMPVLMFESRWEVARCAVWASQLEIEEGVSGTDQSPYGYIAFLGTIYGTDTSAQRDASPVQEVVVGRDAEAAYEVIVHTRDFGASEAERMIAQSLIELARRKADASIPLPLAA